LIDEKLCPKRGAPHPVSDWSLKRPVQRPRTTDLHDESQRWFGVVYARWHDGWAEVDRLGREFEDLDDAKRSMMRAAELQMSD
jgi:hypothetical protein